MSSKRFPFTKKSIEALEAHDHDILSREAEYSDAECIGLHQKESFFLSIFLYELLFVL
ncbi:MAG: hypothetical protein P8Y84_05800 [Desulfuromonadales bacterium]